MATVAVDIDDTLYDFNALSREVICAEAARLGSTELTRAAYAAWTEWRSPADLLPDGEWLRIIDMCHTQEMIHAQQPFTGVYDVLWRIIEAGHSITYISNRDPETHGATEFWLNCHGLPSPNGWDSYGADLDHRVKLICTTKDKMPLIRDCQFIIDDRPKTLVNFVYDFDWKNKYGSTNRDMQRKGFALHREYNAGLTDVPGIYLAKSWTLLAKFLEEKGVAAPATEVAV
jgi:hypothetical protein